MTQNEWHYWAYAYNGSYMAIYCDGVLVRFEDGFNYNLVSNTSKLNISTTSGAIVDEIRLSNAARSADEIKAYYDCAKTKIQ